MRTLRSSVIVLLLSLVAIPFSLRADVTRDGTLGEDVPFEVEGRSVFIDEVQGERSGENLFHSFSDFDVPGGQTAVFRAELPTANVIGRITSGLPTTITGRIRSEIPGANLFLLNPRGILVRQGSTIQVDGSFHLSTADFLEFGGDSRQRFFADPGIGSVLSPVDVSAFGFLSEAPAPIEFQRLTRVTVPVSETVSIIGGDLTFTTSILESGDGGADPDPRGSIGGVRLIALGSPGRVLRSPTTATEIALDEFSRLGRIQLVASSLSVEQGDVEAALFDAPDIAPDALDFEIGESGPTSVDTAIASFEADSRAVIQAAGEAGAAPADALPPAIGGIELVAEQISLVGTQLDTLSGLEGRSGDVRLLARTSIESRDSNLSAGEELGLGAGDILLRAGEFISLEGGELRVEGGLLRSDRVLAQALFPDRILPQAHAGIIRIETDRLESSGVDFTLAGTDLTGPGALDILGRSAVSLRGAQISSAVFLNASLGSGRVRIRAEDVALFESSLIVGDVFGLANLPQSFAGGLEVTAGRSLRLQSSLIDLSSSFSGGASGLSAARLTAPRIQIEDSEINAALIGDLSALDPLGVGVVDLADTDPLDRPPRLSVVASEELELRSSRLLAGTSEGLRDAGAILLRAPTLRIVDSTISTDTSGSGEGGQVRIEAPVSLEVENSIISSITTDDQGEVLLPLELESLSAPSQSEERVLAIEALRTFGVFLSLGVVLPDSDLDAASDVLGADSLDADSLGDDTLGPDTFGPDTIGRDTLGDDALGPDMLGAATDPVAVPGELAAGDAGVVSIDSERARIASGSRISTDSVGSGAAGDVAIRADGSLDIAGASITSQAAASGDAGSVSLDANSVSIRDGAVVATGTTGSGAGGNIEISASSEVSVSGDGTLVSATTDGMGAGGSISIAAPDVVVSAGAEVRAASRGSADAGSIEISADRIGLDRGAVRTDAVQAGGGNIRIEANERLSLRNGSRIDTNVSEANGDGGNIVITGDLTAIDATSTISANAAGGDGGRIEIDSRFLISDPDARSITASSERGRAGTISIAAPDAGPMRSLGPLETRFRSAAELLAPACRVRGGSVPGSLVVESRRGIAVSPDRLLLAFDVPALEGRDAAAIARGGRATASDWRPRAPSEASSGRPADALIRPSAVTQDLAFRAVAGPQDFDRVMGEARSYEELGDYAEANESLLRALIIARSNRDAGQLASVLGRLGNIYVVLGEFGQAEELLNEAVGMARQAGAPAKAATVLNNLGNQLVLDGREREALRVYDEARRIGERIDAQLQVAQAEANAARTALELGELANARRLADAAARSLDGMRPAHDPLYALIHLAGSYERLAAAQPVERAAARAEHLLRAYGLLRRAGLEAEAIGDARAASYAWGNLGRLYANEGRHTEALTLSRRALEWTDDSDASDAAYLWHWQAGRVLFKLGRADEAIGSYRTAVELLQDGRLETALRYERQAASFVETQGLVYLELVDVLLRSASRVEEAAARSLTFEARQRLEQLKAAELRDYFRDECVAELEARSVSVDAVAEASAVVYPVLLPDRLELLVSYAGQLHRFAPEELVSRAEVVEQANLLIASLSSGDLGAASQPRASRKLYDWLVRPYAERLLQQGIQTLVFVPDLSLRALPLAALHDGEDYLIRSFSLALTPGLALTDPRPLDRTNSRVLLAGLSDAGTGRKALPLVSQELAAIGEIYAGQVLQGEDFTTERVLDSVRERPFSMIHVASHAEFSGDPATSFVATHDGELSIRELAEVVGETRFRDMPLELLVLSACETVAGSERAALGLAGIALEAGARSAVGSLFRISDQASLRLMTEFYRQLAQPGVSRAEALRRAQLALLDDAEFAHPQNWAPFLLIGSWL